MISLEFTGAEGSNGSEGSEGSKEFPNVPSEARGIISSVYLPRRGRTQEGAALAVYFAMNISRVLGTIRS